MHYSNSRGKGANSYPYYRIINAKLLPVIHPFPKLQEIHLLQQTALFHCGLQFPLKTQYQPMEASIQLPLQVYLPNSILKMWYKSEGTPYLQRK